MCIYYVSEFFFGLKSDSKLWVGGLQYFRYYCSIHSKYPRTPLEIFFVDQGWRGYLNAVTIFWISYGKIENMIDVIFSDSIKIKLNKGGEGI